MKLKIQRLSSEKYGTHYGVFSEEKLIHIEFSRFAAEKFVTAFEIKKTKTTICLQPNFSKLNNTPSVENLALKYTLSQEEANELSKLLIDMAAMNFSFSHELSKHIIENNLGQKYSNIAVIVTMEKASDKWDYNGGFSKNLYRIICTELKLKNKGTSARAVGFVPYKNM